MCVIAFALLCCVVLNRYPFPDASLNICSLFVHQDPDQAASLAFSLAKFAVALLDVCASAGATPCVCVFLLVSPERWAIAGDSDGAVQIQKGIALRHGGLRKLRSVILAMNSGQEPVEESLCVMMTRVAVRIASHAPAAFACDIVTIPTLPRLLSGQALRVLVSSSSVLQACFLAISSDIASISSTIRQQYDRSGDYPSLGYLLGNVLQLSFARGAVDHSLFLAVGAIMGQAGESTSRMFPRKSEPDGSDSDEDVHMSTVPDQVAEQLQLMTSRRMLDEIAKTLRDGPDESRSAVQVMLHCILQSWGAARSDVLSAVAFGTPLASALWSQIREANIAAMPFGELHRSWPSLALFAALYSHLLRVQDDDEFYGGQFGPITIETVPHIVVFLRAILIRLYWTDSSLQTDWTDKLRREAAVAFGQLRDRQSRRPFCPTDAFLMGDADLLNQFKVELFGSPSRGNGAVLAASGMVFQRAQVLLREVPILIPFAERVRVFYSCIEAEDRASAYPFGRAVRVRRDSLVEDAFDGLKMFTDSYSSLRHIRIEFVDEHGLPEAGIDGGGLWKEFVQLFCKQALDPSTGMFSQTDDHTYYPSPAAKMVRDDYLDVTKFCGMIIGKAIWSQVQIEPVFAGWFLRKLTSSPPCLDDLRSMDPQLYRNLIFLKRHEGDFAELALTFSTVNDELGQKEVVELCPGGLSIPVTRENRLSFIHLLADYKLNRQLHAQCQAFIQGLQAVIPSRWSRIFAPDEMQMLISGSRTPLDIEDMRRHCVYTGRREHVSSTYVISGSLIMCEQDSTTRTPSLTGSGTSWLPCLLKTPH